MNPRVIDNDAGEISVSLDGKDLRGWSYKSDTERRAKMLAAREYAEGWCHGRCSAVSAPSDFDIMVMRELDEARQLVAEANNSLYGSQGYFHSLTGGPFDKYHLSRGIERLKAMLNDVPQTASEAVWSAEVHDRIIKRLMAGVGMPNSISLYTAFKQFANELCALSKEACRCQAESVPTIDDVPSCGQENDYRRALTRPVRQEDGK